MEKPSLEQASKGEHEDPFNKCSEVVFPRPGTSRHLINICSHDLIFPGALILIYWRLKAPPCAGSQEIITHFM